MMDIELLLKQQLSQALQVAFDYQQAPADIQLQPTKKDFEGDYTFVTFPLTKPLRKSPADIGTALGEALKAQTDLVAGFNVVQGFLNLSVNKSAWFDVFASIVSNQHFGEFAPNGQSVMVEYASPNTNKPLHLGHLRNIFLGHSVANILKACGYDVVSTCLVNDRGIHICKSMLAYRLFGNGETPESAGIKGDHLVGKYYVVFDKHYKQEVEALVAQGLSKEEAEKQAPLMLQAQQMLVQWEQNDPAVKALWQQMNGWVLEGFNDTYRTMGVAFDRFYYESDTYLLGKAVVEEGLQEGVFFKKDDGSVWIDLTSEGLDQKLVLRKDGTSVYITQDLGTTDLKFNDYHNDKSIWVVGNEQDYHFEVLFKIMKKLGRPYAEGCFHLSYGMVDLPSGKMKSREGTVVDADELMAEMIQSAEQESQEKGKLGDMDDTQKQQLFKMLGLGALKYFLLKVDPHKRMLFNPQESIDLQGNTGPFIQYSHARICSILRKASQQGLSASQTLEAVIPHASEQELIFVLSQYPQRLLEAGRAYAPSMMAQYAYELAKTYNQFYGEVPILSETDAAKRNFRLVLSEQVAQTIRRAMQLLGIEVPQRM